MSDGPTIQCPNCGAAVVADQRFSHMAVCGSCRSVVTFGEQAAKVAGKLAVLPESRSKLFVGAAGRVHGQDFVVLGRVRYGYGAGYWDEWYLQLGDGSTAWLSEDEREVAFERAEPVSGGPTTVDQLQPGQRLELAGRDFQVVERDIARAEGGEGQLPFVVVEGEAVPFVDLLDDRGDVGTYEVGEDGHRLFVGRPLQPGELELEWTRQETGRDDSMPVAGRATTDGRPRITYTSGTIRPVQCHSCGGGMEVDVSRGVPDVVRCPYCGAVEQLAPRSVTCPSCEEVIGLRSGDEAATVSCPSCQAVVKVRGGAPEVLHLAAERPRVKAPLKPGRAVTWDGVRYTATGWIRYAIEDDGEIYEYDEVMLFSEETGYLWLELSDGHASIGRRIFDGPSMTGPHDHSGHVNYRGDRYREVEAGHARITWVEGELPWIAQVGDTAAYADFAHEPYKLSGEWTATEAEWYLLEYVDREALEAAVEGNLDLGPMEGVAPHQPYSRSRSQATWIVLILALLGGLGTWWTQAGPDERFVWDLPATAYSSDGAASEPFELGRGELVDVEQYASRLDNGWVYLRAALVDEGGEPVARYTTQLMSYKTVSRGSRSHFRSSARLKAPKSGTFRLAIQAEADHVIQTDATRAAPYRPAVKVAVATGARTDLWLSWYTIGCALVLVWLLMHRVGFIFKKKWAEGMDWGGVDADW